MARAALEIADILNRHGDDYLRRHAGHLSLGQLKVRWLRESGQGG